jgi:beta-glucanase (GH16 family)
VYDKTKPYNTQGLLGDYNSNNIRQQTGFVNLFLTKTDTNSSSGTRLSIANDFRYGTVDVKMRVAKGKNVVSSFILMGQNKDEIDFEFVQNSNNKTNIIQTNYFYKGNPIFDKNAKMYRNFKPLTDFYNTYTIHWTPDHYEWRFNNNTLRKLYKNQTEKYPDDTSKIQFGIWEAKPSSWAGPGIDWKEQPFVLSIESIQVSCFNTTPVTSTPSTPSTPITSTPITSTPSTSVTSTPSTSVTSSNVKNNYILYSVLLCLQLFL